MNIPAPENHTDVASGDASQPARKRNIEALTAFFRSGIKPAESHEKLGIELEQTVVRRRLPRLVQRGERHRTSA